jgi:hypothetical protein
MPAPLAVAPGILAMVRAFGVLGRTLPRLAPARVRRRMPGAGPRRQVPEVEPGRQMPEVGPRREMPEARPGRQMTEEGPRRRVPELPDRSRVAGAEHGLRAQLPRAPMVVPYDLGRGVDEDPDPKGWRRPQVAAIVVTCSGRPGEDADAAEGSQEQERLVHYRCLLCG